MSWLCAASWPRLSWNKGLWSQWDYLHSESASDRLWYLVLAEPCPSVLFAQLKFDRSVSCLLNSNSSSGFNAQHHLFFWWYQWYNWTCQNSSFVLYSRVLCLTRARGNTRSDCSGLELNWRNGIGFSSALSLDFKKVNARKKTQWAGFLRTILLYPAIINLIKV